MTEPCHHSNSSTKDPAAFVLAADSKAVTAEIAKCLAPLLEPGDVVLLNG